MTDSRTAPPATAGRRERKKAETRQALVAAARRLRAEPEMRAGMAANQLAHAAHAFDIGRIGRRFAGIIDGVCRV